MSARFRQGALRIDPARRRLKSSSPIPPATKRRLKLKSDQIQTKVGLNIKYCYGLESLALDVATRLDQSQTPEPRPTIVVSGPS
jgi:hypothetical protein